MKTLFLARTLRPAFTIIEILISVIIISVSIVYVLKVHSQNHEQIVYITERNKLSLEDSLFLADNALQFHKEKKDAYEILRSYFQINDSKSIDILKNAKRTFFIPEPVNLTPEEGSGPAATIEEIKLKDKYSSSYFHFKINTF